MSSIDFNKLIHSATYYLSYQDKIGRGFMINESSLKYPVADYLASLEIPLSNIKLEYPHPDLKRRSLDLVMTDNSKGKIENAFEFKISKETTKNQSEQKRIFNDLMRLHLIGQSSGAKCYFLIVETHINFIQNFRSIVSSKPSTNNRTLPDPLGIYTEWFKFGANEEQTFDVRGKTDNIYGEIYKAFKEDYQAKNDKLELPDKIKTKCISITAISRNYPTPYAGGIWQIE